MKIHPSKMKGLVVTRARTRSMHPPSQPFIEGAERVTTLKVLGVLLNPRFTMTDHISQVLNTCSSSMFALRLLRTHSLQPQELHLVARATILASILYATPEWWGFAGEGDRLHLERLMRRRGYLPSDFPNIASMAE